jgi:TDG/mug DNA glycosylase family protein
MKGKPPSEPDWSGRRLTDRIGPGLRVLFVGINPGVRSAVTGHHFAGPSNRFWKLLAESGLVPRRLTFEEDVRLGEFGFGITNLVPRPSPGIDDLKPAEYVAGWKALEAKIRKHKPEVVALVGVTLYRAIRPFVEDGDDGSRRGRKGSRPVALGLQAASIHGARLFVLPNPSGRNANFSYAEMLDAFAALRALLE